MAKVKKQDAVDSAKDTARPDRQMTELELLNIVDVALQNSLGKLDTKLANQRLQAMKYYLGDKVGNLAPPEAEGRSSVISMDVADTIEWILPSLIRIFVGGDNAVEFSAKTEEDVPAAEQATDWANHVFYVQNEGFIILHDFFKDALLQKLGVVKVWWDDSKDITTEEYESVTLEELTLMMQDGTVEVIQQTQNDDGTFSIKVKRTEDTAHTCIENVPPEEFLFSRKARNSKRIFDCHHRVLRTVTELKEAGYKNTDQLMNDDNGAEFSQEAIERQSDTNEFVYGSQFVQPADPSMRFVWITESYMQVDWNGDGLAEWRKIVKSGKVLLANDEIDEHPFAMITPIKMPHKLVGRSVADLLMDLQDIKTALLRQSIDNMYLRNNPRTYVDTTKSVNIDDLLDSRVGGIVRGKGENGIMPISVAEISPQTFSLIEYIDKIKSERTGINDASKGLDANTLNETTNNNRNQLVAAAQAKVELIARIFAETGIKDIFRKILKLSSKYQKQAQVIRRRNKFIPIDPRSWKTQYDIAINVGLGTGNKDQMAAHLMNIINLQKEAKLAGLPIVSEKQIYNSAAKLVANLGFKDVNTFFIDPESEQGRQLAQQSASQPNPELMKLQAEMQLKQAEFQLKEQSALTQNEVQKQNDERDFQRQQAKDQNDLQIRLAEIQAQNEFKLQELTVTAELKREEMELKYQMEREAKLFEYQLQAERSAGQEGEISEPVAQDGGAMAAMHDLVNNSVASMAQVASALAASNGAPKEIKVERDKSGALIGTIGTATPRE